LSRLPGLDGSANSSSNGHQSLSRDARGQKEICSAPVAKVFAFTEPAVGFVHQRSRLHAVPRSFALREAPRQAPQLNGGKPIRDA
jgi:hypothetical protein